MPTGIYKRTKEHNRKLGEATRLRGFTEQQRKRLSEAATGRILSEKTKRKLIRSLTGRKLSEEHKRNLSKAKSGENCHFWKGGISFAPYSVDWTKTLKRSIRERDHYTCQLCGKPQGDRALSVHHINYDKKNCSPDNLITLCRACNAKVNSNRKYWTKYFQN